MGFQNRPELEDFREFFPLMAKYRGFEHLGGDGRDHIFVYTHPINSLVTVTVKTGIESGATRAKYGCGINVVLKCEGIELMKIQVRRRHKNDTGATCVYDRMVKALDKAMFEVMRNW